MDKLFNTLSEVRQANKSLGNYWFNRHTMKFWGSKIESSLLKGRFFISSELSIRKDNRRFTIREVKPDGSIETLNINKLDGFRAYYSKDQAKDSLNEYLKA